MCAWIGEGRDFARHGHGHAILWPFPGMKEGEEDDDVAGSIQIQQPTADNLSKKGTRTFVAEASIDAPQSHACALWFLSTVGGGGGPGPRCLRCCN